MGIEKNSSTKESIESSHTQSNAKGDKKIIHYLWDILFAKKDTEIGYRPDYRCSERYYVDHGLIGTGSECPETLSHEEKILELASQYNFKNILDKYIHRTLLGTCGFSSWSLWRFLNHYKEHYGETYECHLHNMRHVGDSAHAFLTITFANGQSYIIDNTLSQFLNDAMGDYDGNKYGLYLKKNHKNRTLIRFVDDFLCKGYAPLNQKNADMYESIVHNKKISDVEIEKYLNSSDPELGNEYREEEFRRWGYEPLYMLDIFKQNDDHAWFVDNEGGRVYEITDADMTVNDSDDVIVDD